MINTLLIKFLTRLHKNNNKQWFDLHRKEYETIRTEYVDFVDDLIKEISIFDASIATLKGKQCIFRINRDVRFSKNKAPYKTNFGAYFNQRGKNGGGAGYYLHIEPGKSFLAAGVWMPEPELLNNIRQEIDYNWKEWKNLINKSSFKKTFPEGMDTSNMLTRPPKGYAENNPAIDDLKLKSFVVRKSLSNQELSEKNFNKNISKAFKEALPLVAFINRTLD
ncbi:MAG: DUF2461 domain-containing protein [Ferruginibacter sp.]|nr:DUF2461 domain-containing protein [Ferruginibacter sp.]